VNSGLGHHPLAIEGDIENSEPVAGYRADLGPVFAANWTLATGLAFAASGAGIVGVGAIELGTNDMRGLIWDAAADATDQAMLCFTLPGEFSASEDQLVISLWMRKFDTTGSATENADLAMAGILTHLGTGDTAGDVETTVSNTLAVMTAATTRAAFAKYDFTFSAKGLAPDEFVQFIVGPNEAVGTALQVHLLGTRVRVKRHACIARADRGN